MRNTETTPLRKAQALARQSGVRKPQATVGGTHRGSVALPAPASAAQLMFFLCRSRVFLLSLALQDGTGQKAPNSSLLQNCQPTSFPQPHCHLSRDKASSVEQQKPGCQGKEGLKANIPATDSTKENTGWSSRNCRKWPFAALGSTLREPFLLLLHSTVSRFLRHPQKTKY